MVRQEAFLYTLRVNSLRWAVPYALLLLAGAAPRIGLLPRARAFLDVDEAVQALMATHIARGESLPLFFYGMNYAGAPEAYLAGAAVRLGCDAAVAVKAVALLSSLGLLAVLPLLVRRFAGDGPALLAMAYLALPPRFLLEWSLYAVGGYMATLFAGTLLVLLWHRARAAGRAPGPAWFLLAGAGFWISWALVVFLLPVLAWELSRVRFAENLREACGSPREFLAARRWAGGAMGRWVVRCLASAGLLYIALCVFICASGGVTLRVAGGMVGMCDAAKCMKIALALWGLACAASWMRRHGAPRASRRRLACAAAFVLGLSPYVIFPFTEAGRTAGHLPFRLTQGRAVIAQSRDILAGMHRVFLGGGVPFNEDAPWLGSVRAILGAALGAVWFLIVAEEGGALGRLVRLRAVPPPPLTPPSGALIPPVFGAGIVEAIVLAPLVLVPLLAWVRRGFAPRYLLFAVPAMAVAWGILACRGTRFDVRNRRVVFATLLVATLAYHAAGMIAYLREIRARDPAPVAAAIEELTQAGLIHLFTPMGYGYSLAFHSGEAIRITPYDYYDLLPRYTAETRARPSYAYLFPPDAAEALDAFRGHLTGLGVTGSETPLSCGTAVVLQNPPWIAWRMDEPNR